MGYNVYGSLGQGNTTSMSSPVQVGALTTWLNVSAAYHSSAVKTDGTLWSWGFNTYGNLGLGNSGSTTHRSSPTQVGALTTWSSIQVNSGGAHAMAMATDGTLWSWGYNTNGQLGDGTTISKSSPVQVGALTTWSSIGVGGSHSVAIKTNNTIWAWGYNGYGQLGLGNTTDRSSPVQIGTLTAWANVSAVANHTLAIGAV
jgi:alpha-tubulin suppressor-like RCC1 family protein